MFLVKAEGEEKKLMLTACDVGATEMRKVCGSLMMWVRLKCEQWGCCCLKSGSGNVVCATCA